MNDASRSVAPLQRATNGPSPLVRLLVVVAGGLFLTIAFNAWPVLFFTFPVVVWLIDGAAAGRWRGLRRVALRSAPKWYGPRQEGEKRNSSADDADERR